MMRLLGAALLAGAGYGMGLHKLSALARRVEALRQLRQLARRMQDEIEYRALPMDELLELLRHEEGFDALHLECCISLQALALPEVLAPPQREVLAGVLHTIGQRTSEESCRQLAYCQALCGDYLHQEQHRLEQAAALYRQLGLCAGLLAAVLAL